MPFSRLPALLSAGLSELTAALDRRSAPRRLLLLTGALFAKGRRTVTRWFRPAGITTDFRRASSALWAAGRRAEGLARRHWRRDAPLMTPPPTKRRRGQRGPPPTYGKGRIDLAKHAGQRRGWQRLVCVPYTEAVVKTVKTFLATWRPAGRVIRVVTVREDKGWLAYFGTDATATAEAILEATADRGAIEQTFPDVKEVWGAGQQPVRNVYARIGAFAVNLILLSRVEAWAWARAEDGPVDRGGSPWDGEPRRPSHAGRRKALQREVLRAEIQATVGDRAEAEEVHDLAERLLDMAA